MSDRLPSNVIRPNPGYLPTEFSGGDARGFDPSSDVELREYLKVAIKYRYIIGASILACTILALIYALTATPLYVSTSKVRISTYEPVLTATKIEDMLQQKSKETNYLETQLEEMVSYSLADKVLQDPEVKQALEKERAKGFFSSLFGNKKQEVSTADKLTGYSNPIPDIKSYLKSIEVKPVRRTSIVNIEATSESPTISALLANRHAQSYIEWVRDNRVEQQARGLQFLRTQADELREKVGDLEREMADYAEANSIVALNKDENITVQRMSQLNQLLTAVTARRIEAENLFKEAESALRSPSAGFDDPSTQNMRSELAKLESDYGEMGMKFTPSYPRMKQLKSQIEELRRSIEGQRRQIVIGLKAKAAAALEEERNLKEELERQKSQAFELSKRQVQYNVLNRELTSSRELLQSVIKQIKETSLAVESNASNVSIVDLAAVPQNSSYPQKQLFLLVGAAIGAIIGLGIAFLLNYLDNTIRTPEQLASIVQIPSLGVVPSFGLEHFEGVDPSVESDAFRADSTTVQAGNLMPAVARAAPPIAYLNDPKSLASEAYRTIRTGILLSKAGEPPRTILVSSAQSSEGKTTSAINLAACLASAGGRVVIIDADLRRPSVYKHFGFSSNLNGLVEVLTGQQTIEDVSITDSAKRITVIPSGKIPPNPAELLGSMEMAKVLDELGSRFDYVIVDSPPVLPVTDSVILSRYVDGVVLVVRGASTPKKVVRDAKNRLAAVGARFLGAVLNDVDITSGDYYYYNRYYYAYYQKEGKSADVKAAS